MRVKVTFSGLDIDIEKSDAELFLLLLQSAAYNTAVLSTTCLFDIKEKELPLGCEGYNINGPLFHGLGVGVAPLRKQPLHSYKFAPLAFGVPVVGLHKKSFNIPADWDSIPQQTSKDKEK